MRSQNPAMGLFVWGGIIACVIGDAMILRKFSNLCSAALFALLVTSAAAGAHAIVTGTSMNGQPLAANRVAEVELHFNSAVEFNFVRVFLINVKGQETRLVVKAGKTRDAIFIQIPLLKPGAYALRYRLLAVDGHFTDNLLRFAVSEPK